MPTNWRYSLLPSLIAPSTWCRGIRSNRSKSSIASLRSKRLNQRLGEGNFQIARILYTSVSGSQSSLISQTKCFLFRKCLGHGISFPCQLMCQLEIVKIFDALHMLSLRANDHEHKTRARFLSRSGEFLRETRDVTGIVPCPSRLSAAMKQDHGRA